MMIGRSYPPPTRGKLVVWSSIAQLPFGGCTWHRLHWLAGLRRLGFDVWYVEESDRPVYNPTTFWPSMESSENVAYLSRQMDRVGLGDRWVYRPPGVSDYCLGATDLSGLKRLYAEADAVINHTGAQEWRPYHDVIRCLVYVNTDPGALQIEVANSLPHTIQTLDRYGHFFTYGQNLGAADCLVPIERYLWQPTRPPVCVDWWEASNALAQDAPLTTVANWRHSGKDVVWRGVTYRWSKHIEFLRFINLPSRAVLPLELALVLLGDEAISQMRSYGWRVVSSAAISEPSAYREYLLRSRGEFTVAKDQYVRLRTGWFSDRSACYLAAGKPVVTQETGFGAVLPTGEGLFAFSTEDEAAAAIEALARDYDRHCRAAREIAGEYFAAERVLGDLLRRIGLM